MPPEVKKVLKEVTVHYRDQVAQEALDNAAESMKEFLAKGGKMVKLSKAEQEKWAERSPQHRAELARRSRKSEGSPATKFLAAYMDALRAAGEKPARDWDKN